MAFFFGWEKIKVASFTICWSAVFKSSTWMCSKQAKYRSICKTPETIVVSPKSPIFRLNHVCMRNGVYSQSFPWDFHDIRLKIIECLKQCLYDVTNSIKRRCHMWFSTKLQWSSGTRMENMSSSRKNILFILILQCARHSSSSVSPEHMNYYKRHVNE